MAEQPDILILGGGVIGLTTAYYLHKEGVKLEVVRRGRESMSAVTVSDFLEVLFLGTVGRGYNDLSASALAL
jgi:anaerobic glycerol-3-phosphate dehydrogenase